jgi:hypothetical protein
MKVMKRQAVICAAAILTLVCAGLQPPARAQVFDFGQIEEFESLGSGVQKGGSSPKTIVDDDARHTVLFTILESNTEAKIYWKSKDGSQTTIMRGQGLRAFQTIGEFRIEATGDSSRSFRYGYVLLRLKSEKSVLEDKI